MSREKAVWAKILDMAHEIAFFIGTRRDEPARRLWAADQ